MIEPMVKAERIAESHAARAGTAYRPDIDGLRAVAVLSVLFFHAGYRGFSGGFTGVDIFFVISGYLIGGHIYAEETAGKFSFTAFYRRRAKRILPALYAVLLATLALGSLLLSPLELRRAATEGLATLGFASNVFFWKATNYFAVESSQRTLLMTWSLGVEEQFYVFVPLLMVFVLRRRVRLIPVLLGLTGASLAASIYQVAHFPVSAFYLMPGRAWELLGGVLTAMLAVRIGSVMSRNGRLSEALAGAGLLLVGVPILLLDVGTPFPGVAAVPSVIGVAFLLVTPAALVNRRLLSLRPLRFVGRISYSLYLWHWPLLTFTRIVLGTAPTPRQATSVLGVAFFFAWASFRWIEQPFRRSATGDRMLLLRYAAVTALVALLCADAHLRYGWEWRAPALAAQEKQASVQPDPCLVEAPIALPNRGTSCSEDTGKTAVALWGDSHAAALAPAVRDQVHAAGYDFLEVTKSSCPPLVGLGRFLRGSPGFASNCRRFNATVLQQLASDPRTRIVVLAADWKAMFEDPATRNTGWLVPENAPPSREPTLSDSEGMFRLALGKTIGQLQAHHKEVILVEDVPEFEINPLWRVRTGEMPLRRSAFAAFGSGEFPNPGKEEEADRCEVGLVRKMVEGIGRENRVEVLDPVEKLCNSEGLCRYREGAQLFYEDQQHLSRAGAFAALAGWRLPPAQSGLLP